MTLPPYTETSYRGSVTLPRYDGTSYRGSMTLPSSDETPYRGRMTLPREVGASQGGSGPFPREDQSPSEGTATICRNSSSSARCGSSQSPAWTGETWMMVLRGATSPRKRSRRERRTMGPASGSPSQMRGMASRCWRIRSRSASGQRDHRQGRGRRFARRLCPHRAQGSRAARPRGGRVRAGGTPAVPGLLFSLPSATAGCLPSGSVRDDLLEKVGDRSQRG